MLGWTGDNGDPDNFLDTCCSAATPSAATTARSGATRSSTILIQKAKETDRRRRAHQAL
jgi:ABC-type oligopeptide transport system substrate-binding subunit